MNSIFLVLLITSGCYSISDQDHLLSNSAKIRSANAQCFTSIPMPAMPPVFNKKEFTLLSWNIFKGNKQGWMQDLLDLSDTSDLILLQEAYLTHELSQFLEINGYNWDMVSAFRYKGIDTGVMTIARTQSLNSCILLTYEALAPLPKSALVSYYPIGKSHKTLLVANTHAINFTFGTELFSKQLRQIKKLLAQHKGPIVFAGDFNTWSEQRETALNQIMGDKTLGLQKVEFDSSLPVLFWGHQLDHIFFRDLKFVHAEAIPVDSSDHFPLKVKFELLPEVIR